MDTVSAQAQARHRAALPSTAATQAGDRGSAPAGPAPTTTALPRNAMGRRLSLSCRTRRSACCCNPCWLLLT